MTLPSHEPSAQAAVPGPRVSLCMTVLNEARGLPEFLRTLSAQTQLPDEIVVVDGGSTDDTVAILEGWATEAGVPATVLTVPGANISRGRNEAIAAATSPWVAITDGGTRLDTRWLAELKAQMADDVEVVSGFFRPLEGGGFAEALGSIITPLLTEIDGDAFLPSSRSVAFRKSAWERVGGYPEWLDYCEDLVFDMAMREAPAGRHVFAPDAIVEWDARGSISAFAKQYYRYARGDGKALLWSKRHAARYGAYAFSLIMCGAAVKTRSLLPLALVTLGAVGYMSKYFRRALARRTPLARTLVLVPLVTVVGDAAKMCGYPVGRVWRRVHAPDRWRTEP